MGVQPDMRRNPKFETNPALEGVPGLLRVYMCFLFLRDPTILGVPLLARVETSQGGPVKNRLGSQPFCNVRNLFLASVFVVISCSHKLFDQVVGS